MDMLSWLGLWILKIYLGLAALAFLIFLYQDAKETILRYKDMFVSCHRYDYVVPFLWYDTDLFGAKNKKLLYWVIGIPNVIASALIVGICWPYVLIIVGKDIFKNTTKGG